MYIIKRKNEGQTFWLLGGSLQYHNLFSSPLPRQGRVGNTIYEITGCKFFINLHTTGKEKKNVMGVYYQTVYALFSAVHPTVEKQMRYTHYKHSHTERNLGEKMLQIGGEITILDGNPKNAKGMPFIVNFAENMGKIRQLKITL